MNQHLLNLNTYSYVLIIKSQICHVTNGEQLLAARLAPANCCSYKTPELRCTASALKDQEITILLRARELLVDTYEPTKTCRDFAFNMPNFTNCDRCRWKVHRRTLTGTISNHLVATGCDPKAFRKNSASWPDAYFSFGFHL